MDKPTTQEIKKVMSFLGSKTSDKKKASSKLNGAKRWNKEKKNGK